MSRLCLPAAFSQSTLLADRWLLGGVPPKADGVWHDVLKMDPGKQHVFLQRVLFIHDVTKRKAGKAQSLRVPQATWDLEADLACLGGFILESMKTHRDPENLVVFPVETIATVLTSFIEGFLVNFSILFYVASCPIGYHRIHVGNIQPNPKIIIMNMIQQPMGSQFRVIK